MSLLQKVSSCCVIASFVLNFCKVDINTIHKLMTPKSDRQTIELIQEKDINRSD
jgi:hypothetical protein